MVFTVATVFFGGLLEHSSGALQSDGFSESDGLLWLIAAYLAAEADDKAVPRVDGGNREGEVHQFFVGKMRLDAFIDLVRDMIVGNQSESLGPFQRCSLSLSVKWRFSPGGKQIDTLLTLSSRAGIFRVHIDAIGTSINLR